MIKQTTLHIDGTTVPLNTPGTLYTATTDVSFMLVGQLGGPGLSFNDNSGSGYVQYGNYPSSPVFALEDGDTIYFTASMTGSITYLVWPR